MFGLNYINLSTIVQIIQTVIDILIVWIVLYYGLKIVRNNSRTIQIFKGIIFVIIIQAFARLFNLTVVANLTAQFISWGPLALIILFQPEIRNLLEKFGKTNVFSGMTSLTVNERENLVDELVKASVELSNTMTGALISIEQAHSLSDFIKTGTKMNSIVTSELLCSIFVPGTPLHDGAVIIQGDKIACASAYFPPTNFDFPSSYGARHRAAIGISEITDSVSIIVSEETGKISIAEGGQLHVMNEESLRRYLMRIICHVDVEVEENKNRQIKSLNDDEIEFANGKESESHRGPKITAHLMNKSNKKFTKSKKNVVAKQSEETAETKVEKVESTKQTEEVKDTAEKKPKKKGRSKKSVEVEQAVDVRLDEADDLEPVEEVVIGGEEPIVKESDSNGEETTRS